MDDGQYTYTALITLDAQTSELFDLLCAMLLAKRRNKTMAATSQSRVFAAIVKAYLSSHAADIVEQFNHADKEAVLRALQSIQRQARLPSTAGQPADAAAAEVPDGAGAAAGNADAPAARAHRDTAAE